MPVTKKGAGRPRKFNSDKIPALKEKKKTPKKTPEKIDKRSFEWKWHNVIKPELATIAQRISEGVNQKTIAEEMFGVSEWTFSEWIKRSPLLKETINEARGSRLDKIEKTAFEKAMGLKPDIIITTKEERIYNPATKQYEMVVVKKDTVVKQEANVRLLMWLARVYGKVNKSDKFEVYNTPVEDTTEKAADKNFRDFAENMEEIIRIKRETEEANKLIEERLKGGDPSLNEEEVNVDGIEE